MEEHGKFQQLRVVLALLSLIPAYAYAGLDEVPSDTDPIAAVTIEHQQ